MKSAAKSETQQKIDKFMGKVANVVSAIAYVFTSLFQSPHVRVAMFGVLTLLFLLVNVESYYLALPGDQLPFLPKPYIEDGASLRFFPVGWNFLLLTLAFFVTTGIQAIQSAYWDIQSKPVNQRLNYARAEYDKVKDFTEVKAPNEAHQVAKAAARRHNRIRQGVSRIGALVGATFLVDLIQGLMNYQPFGQGVGGLFVNIIYLLIVVVGTDYMGSLFFRELKNLRND